MPPIPPFKGTRNNHWNHWIWKDFVYRYLRVWGSKMDHLPFEKDSDSCLPIPSMYMVYIYLHLVGFYGKWFWKWVWKLTLDFQDYIGLAGIFKFGLGSRSKEMKQISAARGGQVSCSCIRYTEAALFATGKINRISLFICWKSTWQPTKNTLTLRVEKRCFLWTSTLPKTNMEGPKMKVWKR